MPADANLFPAPSLSTVARGSLCSGCGGCALIAPNRISMEMTAEGLLRPQQSGPVSETEDASIRAICPGIGEKAPTDGPKREVLWGSYTSAVTGHAKDSEIRHIASSGGALTAILVHLLEAGEVDGVVQVGADPDRPLANRTVVSRNRDEIVAAAGSRYAPSAPLAALTHLLDGKERFAFVGKPCDVSALRALSRRDKRVAERFPILLSFFCAGVSSETGAQEILRDMGVCSDEVVAFRYRGLGWPGLARATLSDGSERTMSYHESWGGILSRHVQHRCKICADGTGNLADLVCADAWNADEDGYPLFEEEDGVSLIMARTGLGQSILEAAETGGAITCEPFEIDHLTGIQPGQRRRRRALAARLAGQLCAGRPIPRYRGLSVIAAARQNSLTDNLRNFMGTLRRVLMRRTGG